MPLRQGLFALLLLALVSACSSDVKIYVAPVPEVDNQFEPDEVWSARVGDGVDDFYTRLRPAVAYGKVFAASRFGDIEAFDAASGESLWQTDVSPRQPGWWGENRAPLAAPFRRSSASPSARPRRASIRMVTTSSGGWR